MRFYRLELVPLPFRIRPAAQQQGVGKKMGFVGKKGWKRGGLLRVPGGFVLKGLGFFEKPGDAGGAKLFLLPSSL